MGGGWRGGPVVPTSTEHGPPDPATPEDFKSEISLGELNPLIHSPDLRNIAPLSHVVRKKITENGGVLPVSFDSVIAYDNLNEDLEPRVIAKFEVDELSEKQFSLLEELVEYTYKTTVRTRTDPEGNDIPPENYPTTSRIQQGMAKTGGWYMGPDMSPTTSLHTGLFVFRDLGSVNKDNFFTEPSAESKYIVEVRELGLYQTDLAAFITQVGSILGTGKEIDPNELLYQIYYDLMRSSLKKVGEHSVHGMGEALAQIKRGLVLPLANIELSRGVVQDPESVLLVGVPGTGKTLIIEQLLHEDTGVFILPVDPLELHKELMKDKSDQTLLPRIAEVANGTGRRVILHIDDIETMAKEDSAIHSTLLNLMAGINDSGFYVIASTNVPEKLNVALLQPQRFGILIYCGLQDSEARLEILKIHATSQSLREGHSLFESEEEREIVLEEVARHTDNFTPRYLAEIATVAKSYLLERVTRETGKTVGLTEAALKGFVFTSEDWEKAVVDVTDRYNKDETKKRDKFLQNFVSNHNGIVGFSGPDSGKKIFRPEIQKRIAALHEADQPEA